MNDLTVLSSDGDYAAWLARLSGMSDEELMRELSKWLGLSAHSLLRSAQLVHVLESRDVDLSGLKVGMLNHLRKIACGQLLPEVVVRFGGRPLLIGLIGNLPIDEQRRLATGEHVKLLVYGDDGKRTHRLADPLAMTPKQIRQAFALDHVRTDAEQALLLDERQEQARSAGPEHIGSLRIDRERGGVMIGRHFIPQADLAAALAVLKKPRAAQSA